MRAGCVNKKYLSGEADWADAKTPPVTFSRPPKIHCYNPYLLLGKQRRAEP